MRALTVGSLNIVCGSVTVLAVQPNSHHRSWAPWPRTEGTGGPLCPETSMNTHSGQWARSDLLVGGRPGAEANPVNSEG